jgi:hypothetical protein
MRVLRLSISTVAFLLVAAACGDATTTTTTQPVDTTAVATTLAPITTTTTTAAVTTTVAETTTTLAADAHPVFGVRWADVWPGPTESAAYDVTLFDGGHVELPGHMEYGVEFAGGTFDRLVVGTPEPGNHAMTIYFDRSVPWEIRVVGEESYSVDRTDRADSVYVFEEPMVFSGLTDFGVTEETEGALLLTISTGDTFDLGVTYSVTPRDIETVTVGAGTFGDVLVVDALVGGELIGGGFAFPVEISLHADQFIVRFVGASGFDSLELASPWE